MRPISKAKLLEAFKQAHAAKKEELFAYQELVKSIVATPATEAHQQLLNELGIDGFMKLMEGECFPPTNQDWKRIKGYEWYETPNERQLKLIADSEIRSATYFYSITAEHTQRYKAAAKFFSYFGAANDEILTLFAYWQETSKLVMIESLEKDSLSDH